MPLYQFLIPCSCSNMRYEAAVSGFLDRMPPGHVSARHLGFGDLLLEEIRQYGEEQLELTGFTPLSRPSIHLSWRRHSLVGGLTTASRPICPKASIRWERTASSTRYPNFVILGAHCCPRGLKQVLPAHFSLFSGPLSPKFGALQ